jgi:hypothetical protein
MLLILDNKSIDILIKSGNGKKDGEVRLWLNKDLVELVEQHMDIVIDFIQLHYMLILWMNSLLLKYLNNL